MQLFLVRHGETKENTQKIIQGHLHGSLTALGLEQAKETAKKLKSENFAHIYSSDLQRAIDTAEIIKAEHPDTPLTFTKEAREVNLGNFQGKHWDRVDWDGLKGSKMDRKPEGGESLRELRKRAINFIFELYEKHKDTSILLITHGGFMRQVIAFFEKTPPDKIYEHYSIKNGSVLKINITGNKEGKILNLPEVLDDDNFRA